MTRQTKSLFVIGCVVAGVIAMGFLLGEDKGEVRLIVSPVSSNRVLVTITNSFKTTIGYYLCAQGSEATGIKGLTVAGGKVSGCGTKIIQTPGYGTNHWRFALEYYHPSP